MNVKTELIMSQRLISGKNRKNYVFFKIIRILIKKLRTQGKNFPEEMSKLNPKGPEEQFMNKNFHELFGTWNSDREFFNFSCK